MQADIELASKAVA